MHINKLKNAFRLLLLLLFAAGISSCSDLNPLDKLDDSEAPGIPEIESHKPDVSYFTENYPADSSSTTAAEYSNFNTAAVIASGSASALSSTLTIGSSFLSLAKTSGVQRKDGKWVWEYSASYKDESLSVRLEAESTDNGFKWIMILNSSNTDGQEFNDYKFLEGTVSTDGDQGDIKLFDYEPDQDSKPAVNLDWEVKNDSTELLNFTTHDEDQWTHKVDYEEKSPEYWMTVETNDSDPIREIYWNTDKGTGYLKENTSKGCWNAQFENVSCN